MFMSSMVWAWFELGQDGTHLVEEVGANPACAILHKEPFQALMPEPDNHTVTVACIASRVNGAMARYRVTGLRAQLP